MRLVERGSKVVASGPPLQIFARSSRIVAGSDAEPQGVKTGDIVLAIDMVSALAKSRAEVSEMLSGALGAQKAIELGGPPDQQGCTSFQGTKMVADHDFLALSAR